MSKIVDRPLQFEPLRKPYMRQTPTNLHWSSNHQAVPCTNMNSNTLLDWTNCQKEKQYRQVRSLKEDDGTPQTCFSGPIPKPCLSFLLRGLSPMNTKHGKKKLLRWLCCFSKRHVQIMSKIMSSILLVTTTVMMKQLATWHLNSYVITILILITTSLPWKVLKGRDKLASKTCNLQTKFVGITLAACLAPPSACRFGLPHTGVTAVSASW